MFLSITEHRAATTGHSNTVRCVSLECYTQHKLAMSVTTLPLSGGTLFTTSDGRTVDNTRPSEILVENSDFYRASAY